MFYNSQIQKKSIEQGIYCILGVLGLLFILYIMQHTKFIQYYWIHELIKESKASGNSANIFQDVCFSKILWILSSLEHSLTIYKDFKLCSRLDLSLYIYQIRPKVYSYKIQSLLCFHILNTTLCLNILDLQYKNIMCAQL